MSTKPINCIQINLKRPVIVCRVQEQDKKDITPPETTPAETTDPESDFKRSFSVRLGEAVKGLATGKKSIKDIEKPKRKYVKRRKKKT